MFDPREIDFDSPLRIWLSRGRATVISAEDWELAADVWQFHRDQRGKPYVRRQVRIYGRQLGIYLHRAVMLRVSPRPSPAHVVDHINGNGLDNRRQNLRWVTPKQNLANKAKWGKLKEVLWDRAVVSDSWVRNISNL